MRIFNNTSRRRRGSAQRRQRGAAAIEFALTVPVIFGIFAGVVDLSWYVSRFHMVARAARDGARVGSVTIEGADATGDEIEAAAIAQATAMLTTGGANCDPSCDVSAEWEQDADDGYYYVTVTIGAPFVSFTNLLPFLETKGLDAHFTMMTAQQ